MARTFFLSKLWQGILTRLGVIETIIGALPPIDDYNTVADVRAETSHSNADRILCLENQFVYVFNSSSTAVDNGVTVLKPTDIDAGSPGRWVSDYQLALKTHTHPEKANVITNPNQSRFLVSDANGQPVESTSLASSFATAGHDHDIDYVPIGAINSLVSQINSLVELLEEKMDKPNLQASDVGKPAVFDAERNVIPGSSSGFYQYASGALVAGVTKSCPHNRDMANGYGIIARTADNSNNAVVQVLKPTPSDPSKSVDIQSSIDVAAPGLIIQIFGS